MGSPEKMSYALCCSVAAAAAAAAVAAGSGCTAAATVMVPAEGVLAFATDPAGQTSGKSNDHISMLQLVWTTMILHQSSHANRRGVVMMLLLAAARRQMSRSHAMLSSCRLSGCFISTLERVSHVYGCRPVFSKDTCMVAVVLLLLLLLLTGPFAWLVKPS
jgi:hypothetical protein